VGNAVDALEHKLNVELGGIDPLRDSQRAMRAAENILKTLARAPRLTLTDSEARLKEQQIVGRLARTLAVSEPELRRRLGDVKKKRRGGTERDAENKVLAKQRGPWIPRELELLEILVLAPENVDFVMENISPQHFTEGPLRQIFNLYCECYQSGQEVDFNRIMMATEDPPTKSMLAELAESVDAKTKLDLAKITFWLQQVISSFRQVEGEQVQRQALSRLDSAQLKENEEEDILAQILEEKKREQEVQQQRLSTPWEGQ
ncbi:MAG: DnaB-like helicase N-terminal domain-containing protein, partial [Planctomycetota bacterium]|nr:DnaB-like helicase N-terminal domain-containing protein [Planctomycetota bacterium]